MKLVPSLPERDYGVEAQRAAEAHLAACFEALHACEEDPEQTEIDDPSSAPFCGCDTCMVREVLWAAWPIMEEAVLA